MPEREQRDPLERGLFRRGADGFLVFFPWGLTGRGYRLPDEAAKRPALRAVALLLASAVAVAGWAARVVEDLLREPGDGGRALDALVGPAMALAAIVAAYALWAARFVEPFPPSDLAVPREERLREAAAAVSPRKVLGVGLGVAALGLLALALDPRAAAPGALTLAVGTGLCLGARALQRAARAAAPSDRVAT